MSFVLCDHGARDEQRPPDEINGVVPKSTKRDAELIAGFGGVALLAAAVFIAAALVKPPIASATPRFARQTGHPCATCHTTIPRLTPYGRGFKAGRVKYGLLAH
jgi:hypothetical protein